MEVEEKDYEKIFEMARRYLLSFKKIDNIILQKHLDDWKNRKLHSMSELLRAMLESAKNRQRMKTSIGDIEKLRPFLFDFNSIQIAREYGDDWKKLFNVIKGNYKPPGPMVITNPRSFWVSFCKTILDASRFLSKFSGIKEFDKFVSQFYIDDYTRKKLPLLIEREVYGLGFPLACDFLKEHGYPKYVKPDVHIIDIFNGIGISYSRRDLEVFDDVIKFAKAINKIPYVVDKLFWLVGSGDFYLAYPNDPIKTNKKEFLEKVKDALILNSI